MCEMRRMDVNCWQSCELIKMYNVIRYKDSATMSMSMLMSIYIAHHR